MSGTPPRADVGEVPLTGGNVASSVVRVGDTVRKPAGPQTPAVHALLEHLRSVGFAGAPRSLGIDDAGRHVLEYVPGHAADRGEAPDPAVVGRLARDLHDALAEWAPPRDAVWACPIPTDGADLVIHNDLATWDLAYLAIGLGPLRPATAPAGATARLRALADGYGLDEEGRERLAATLAPRATSMYDLLARGHAAGTEPWARLWAEGHGTSWHRDAAWCHAHARQLRRALLG